MASNVYKSLEKALSMRRDFTIQESAELLGVRAEELMEALAVYVERDGELPPVKETTRVKPDAKPKKKPARKPLATSGARKKL